MNYFNDILNVYAYLRHHLTQEADKAKDLTEQIGILHDEIGETRAEIEKLREQQELRRRKLLLLAQEHNIDISDLLSPDQATPPAMSSDLPAITDTGRIRFPKDFDFEAGFSELVRRAHEAGFTDVHPEQLLTQEEIADAMAFGQQLDSEFESATGLKNKDIAVLVIAVAIRVTCHFLLFMPQVSEQPDQASPDQTGDTVPMLDAASGVDFPKVLRKNDCLEEPAPAAQITMPDFSGLGRLLGMRTRIRDHQQILREIPPFAIGDNRLFTREQIVGYDKYLGWVFGVVNLLTDTVTTKDMKTYTVGRKAGIKERPFVDQEISTLFQMMYPAIQAAKNNQESLIAAVIQEAVALEIPKGGENVLTLYERAVDLDQRSKKLMDQGRSVMSSLMENTEKLWEEMGLNLLINSVVAAAHSFLYDNSEGDLSMYAIRTNKILLCSEFIAAGINSLPALITKDLRHIDRAGIMGSLLTLFHSTSFWIDVKADFLVNRYKQELDPILKQLDSMFDYQ